MNAVYGALQALEQTADYLDSLTNAVREAHALLPVAVDVEAEAVDAQS